MRYVDKQFLSGSPHESGSMFCKISTVKTKDITQWVIRDKGTIDGDIQIRDCHNQVTLDFSASGPKAFGKRVEKIDHMIKMLTAFRKQYVEMWESHQRDVAFKAKEMGIVPESNSA